MRRWAATPFAADSGSPERVTPATESAPSQALRPGVAKIEVVHQLGLRGFWILPLLLVTAVALAVAAGVRTVSVLAQAFPDAPPATQPLEEFIAPSEREAVLAAAAALVEAESQPLTPSETVSGLLRSAALAGGDHRAWSDVLRRRLDGEVAERLRPSRIDCGGRCDELDSYLAEALVRLAADSLANRPPMTIISEEVRTLKATPKARVRIGVQPNKIEVSFILVQRDENWRILDVRVDGVSLMKTLRYEFRKLTKSGRCGGAGAARQRTGRTPLRSVRNPARNLREHRRPRRLPTPVLSLEPRTQSW